MKTELKFGEVKNLSALIDSNDNQVNFKNLFETSFGGASLLAFQEGQKLDKHVSPFGVMVLVLEGEIDFTMLEELHTLHKGEFLLMGDEVPHSVFAKKDSKVLLIKIKVD